MMTGYMWPIGQVTIKRADGTEVASNHDHCIPLFTALIGYAELYSGAVKQDELKFAIGTKLDSKGAETLYVEHKVDNTTIVRTELTPKRCRTSIANPSLGNAISRATDLSIVAPALWYAYLYSEFGSEKKGNDFQKICDALIYGVEDLDDFELALIKFEAKAQSILCPISGQEKSLPMLDKKVEGPTKIISGVFETFPAAVAAYEHSSTCTRQEIQKWRLTSNAIEAYRNSLRAEDLARIPERRDDYVFGESARHAFQRAFITQNDPRDFAVKTFALFGPPASGKSELATVFGELNGLPVRRQVFGKSFCWDDLMEQIVPFIVKGDLPNFNEDERLVNEALKADADGDPLEVAREALGFPATSLEVKFDPESALAILGPAFEGKTFLEMDDELSSRAKAVLSSMQAKISSAGVKNEFLGFKTIVSEFMEWFINGGVIELSETSTANPAELARLHDVLDFSKDCWLTTATGTHKRHSCCYAFVTNNTDGDENNVMPAAVLSRMAVPIYVPAPSDEEATSRLCKTLGCENKRAKAKQIVDAYLALGAEARELSLPGDLDFRQLKQIGNMILNHDADPRSIFTMEVVTHFTSYSDPYDRQKDKESLLSIMDELDLFR